MHSSTLNITMTHSLVIVSLFLIKFLAVNCIDFEKHFGRLTNLTKTSNAIATDCKILKNRRRCKLKTESMKLATTDVIDFVVDAAGRFVKCRKAFNKGNRWYGNCDGDADDANFVTRVDNDGVERMYGSIHVGDEVCRIGPNVIGEEEINCTPTWQFKPENDPKVATGAPKQRILVRDNLFGFTPAPNRRGSQTSLRQTSIVGQNRELFDDSGDNIDIVVVWTKNAECGNAGLANGCSVSGSTENLMRGLIELAVAETNTAYELSGIFTKLRLVHAYRDPDYIEGGDYETYLNDITNDSDGIMDSVHKKRALYGADMVHLIVGEGSSCGIACVGEPSVDYMFGVTSYDCATGFYTFGHEVGHNLNMNHDRGEENKCSESGTYNYGYKDPAAAFRTIMSYNCKVGQCDNMPKNGCTRAQRFSNSDPSYTFDGKRTGNARHDNARQLNSVRALVASFFPAMNCNSDNECNDNDASTVDTCNVSNGACVFTPGRSAPVKSPVKAPTKAPAKAPTKAPVKAPTKAPVKAPTKAPVKAPTRAPVKAPTKAPVKTPTKAPAKAPTKAPIKAPVRAPIHDDCSVSYFLFDTDTNENFITLDGSNVSGRPCNLNIEAKVDCSSSAFRGSVRLVLKKNGSAGPILQQRTENLSPYYLWGNVDTNVFTAQLMEGRYTIQAFLNGVVSTPPLTFTLDPCQP